MFFLNPMSACHIRSMNSIVVLMSRETAKAKNYIESKARIHYIVFDFLY
jgi:hypothetical protein